VPENSLLGNSNADKILSSMRDSELMKQAAASGGIGLADMLYRQIKKDSEAIVPAVSK
jgi:flagellar protein FlgJ